jgi:hypothetical protein
LGQTQRATFAEQTRYQEQQSRLPFQERGAELGREQQIQSRVIADAQRRENEARAERDRLRSQGAVRRSDFGGTGRGPDQAFAQAQIEQTDRIARAEEELGRRVGLTTQERQRGVEIQRQAAQNSIEQTRNEAAIAQAREGRIGSNSRRFGEMNSIERRLALQSLEFTQRTGWGNTPQMIRQRVSQAFPGFAGAEAERFGESTPEYQRARALGGFGADTQTLAQARASTDAAQRALQEATLTSQRNLSQAAVEILDRSFADLIRALASRMNSTVQGFREGQQLRNAQGS